MRVVVDASVAVKWLLPDKTVEGNVDKALALLEGIKEGSHEPLQPPHWLAEVAAVMSRIHPEFARTSIELLYAMDLPVVDEMSVSTTAVELARQLDHHLFDTLYHAVALEHGAILMTADERYFRKAHHLGSLQTLGS